MQPIGLIFIDGGEIISGLYKSYMSKLALNLRYVPLLGLAAKRCQLTSLHRVGDFYGVNIVGETVAPSDRRLYAFF